jgi:hypothetical protein
LLRNIYHYWFHMGEAHAIRQRLGHDPTRQFVGNVTEADYRRYSSSRITLRQIVSN